MRDYPIIEGTTRNCPQCDDIIVYLNKYNCSKGVEKNTVCKKCARTNIARNPEVAEKKRAYGKAHRQEFIERMKKAIETPEAIENHKLSLKKFNNSPEGKKVRSEASKKAHANLQSGFHKDEYKTRRLEWALKGLQKAHTIRSSFSKKETELAIMLEKHGFFLNRGKSMFGGYLPDIIHDTQRVIVEFYGDYYHCNPKIKRYVPDFWNKCKKMTASQIWEHDDQRIKYLESLGWKVIIVWESDFKKDPNVEVQRVVVQSGLDMI